MYQVLVVDDEAAMRAALEANFRQQGWKVTTAGGTSEALERFRLAPCPLVVTDMRMPDGDGLRVMQGVRALAPETAVIFLTAFANVPEAVHAMQEGACDYLVKPISFEPLNAASSGRSPASMWRTMFSSMTMASSTTKPTESVKARSDRLSRL